MPLPTKKLIFFDLETAGCDAARHPIIQLAAIAVDAALEPLEAFEVKLCFDAKRANKQSLRKNHYRPGVWAKEAVGSREAAYRFSEFLRRHATVPSVSRDGEDYFVAQLVAHNAAFDGPFLLSWFERERIFLPARKLILCTLQRSLWLASESPDVSPPRDHKLATLCEHFRVPFHAASAHEALGDVTATVGLYRALRFATANSERRLVAA